MLNLHTYNIRAYAMEVEEIRSLFPQLSEKVYGKPLVYLDNAATSLRPQTVLDKWKEMSVEKNSNLHRAVHHIAALATEEYEQTRDVVKDFINARSREEIIFTSGATMSLNLVASSFSQAFLKRGDKIVIAQSEHHSNIVPWQIACGKIGADILVLPVDDYGCIDLESVERIIDDKTVILCLAQVSNVLGIVNPIKEVARICHERGCMLLVDGAQGVVHCNPDVQEMECDFYAFSGHKMYAAPGTGVLYGRMEILEKMPPFLGGGEMIAKVRFGGTSYAPLPGKFEAGTQNISGTPTLKEAINMVNLLKDRDIAANSERILHYATDALLADKRVKLYGVPRGTKDKISVFSFSVNGVHHEDLALILDKMGIAVRSGQMCAEPLMERMGVTGMLRASFAPYNTMQEAKYFIESLDKAINMLS